MGVGVGGICFYVVGKCEYRKWKLEFSRMGAKRKDLRPIVELFHDEKTIKS